MFSYLQRKWLSEKIYIIICCVLQCNMLIWTKHSIHQKLLYTVIVMPPRIQKKCIFWKVEQKISFQGVLQWQWLAKENLCWVRPISYCNFFLNEKFKGTQKSFYFDRIKKKKKVAWVADLSRVSHTFYITLLNQRGC